MRDFDKKVRKYESVHGHRETSKEIHSDKLGTQYRTRAGTRLLFDHNEERR